VPPALKLWLADNWALIFALVLGAVMNLMKRPHPKDLVGFPRIFWLVIDRACFLTVTRYPQFKWFLIPSPYPVDTSSVAAPTDGAAQKDQT
jgi:hypothetical protein